jgi:hypothetical protein
MSFARHALALCAVGLAGAGFAAPATAQEEAGDTVNQVIVYGDDPCPASAEGEIVVCARLDEGERYRIPKILRQSDSPQNESWAERAKSFETVGEFGIMSCSPVGLGGATGCTQKLIDAAYAEKEQAPGVRMAQLIEEERQKRLAEIDAEAADEQSRVEALEREYEERQRALAAEQAGEATIGGDIESDGALIDQPMN